MKYDCFYIVLGLMCQLSMYQYIVIEYIISNVVFLYLLKSLRPNSLQKPCISVLLISW